MNNIYYKETCYRGGQVSWSWTYTVFENESFLDSDKHVALQHAIYGKPSNS